MLHRLDAKWLLTALLLLQGASVSRAQVSRWQLGGDGLQWTGNDSISILVDVTPTAIQPFYLTPDQNVFTQLDNWSARKFPHELGFVDGERPRAWWLGLGSDVDYSATYLIDGDSSSYLPPTTEGRYDWFTFDLAVPVPAFRIGFFTPPQGFRASGLPLSEDVTPAYEISIAPAADPVWLDSGSYQRIGRVIAEVAENFSANVQVEFPRQYVRFVRWRRNPSSLDIDPSAVYGSDGGVALAGTIGDFELFAHGAPASALYLSAIVDLDQEVNFGRLSWSATPMRVLEDGVHIEDPEASAWLSVEVRTGRDSDPQVYHEFDNKGREVVVERNRYEFDLRSSEDYYVAGERPGVRASVTYDTDNWTYWTALITEPNRPLNLQSGSHIQLKLILHSEDFDAYLRLDSLWVETAPLLAGRVLGEVARLDDMQPQRGFSTVNLGEQTDFAYDIDASFADEVGRGFDGLRLRTGGRTVFKRLEMGQPLAPVEPRSVRVEEDALVVVLPRAVTARDNAPIRVIFATELFLFATTFDGEVFTADDQSLPQPIQPGDAAAAISTSSLRVLATDGKQSDPIQDLRFSTPVLTPNGDGVHERVEITYALFRLPEAAAVELCVFTLDGLQMAKLPLGDQRAGPQRVFWDGRNADGRLLPPGVYVLGITLRSETGAKRRLRPLGIAY